MNFSIKQLSEVTGISSFTLRYYEKEGLIPNIQRSAAGKRQYSESDIEWIKFIMCLKSTGMSISDMKEFVKLTVEGDTTASERRELLFRHKEVMLKKMDEMNNFILKLDSKIKYYEDLEKLIN